MITKAVSHWSVIQHFSHISALWSYLLVCPWPLVALFVWLLPFIVRESGDDDSRTEFKVEVLGYGAAAYSTVYV